MDGKSIHLYSFDRYDDNSGTYYTKCVCGSMIAVTPKMITSTTLTCSCRACYLNYTIHCSGKLV